MQELNKIGNKITFRGIELDYVECIKLDDNTIHLVTEQQINLFFADDTMVNGETYASADELINAIELL